MFSSLKFFLELNTKKKWLEHGKKTSRSKHGKNSNFISFDHQFYFFSVHVHFFSVVSQFFSVVSNSPATFLFFILYEKEKEKRSWANFSPVKKHFKAARDGKKNSDDIYGVKRSETDRLRWGFDNGLPSRPFAFSLKRSSKS